MKKIKVKTNSKNIILEKYHDFLAIFSKKVLNTIFVYQKYNCKIYLEDEKKLSIVLLHKIIF